MTEDKTKAPAEVVDYAEPQAKVAELLAFHGHPVGAQLLREVLGYVGGAAAEAARRRPANRPAYLKGWNPPALRALAELCSALAPEVGTINAPSDPDMFPDAVSPEPSDAGIPGTVDIATAALDEAKANALSSDSLVVVGYHPGPIETAPVSPAPPVPGQAAAVAEIEREIREGVNGVTDPPNPFDEPAHPWHRPDPIPAGWIDDEVWDAAIRWHKPDPLDETAEANPGK